MVMSHYQLDDFFGSACNASSSEMAYF